MTYYGPDAGRGALSYVSSHLSLMMAPQDSDLFKGKQEISDGIGVRTQVFLKLKIPLSKI